MKEEVMYEVDMKDGCPPVRVGVVTDIDAVVMELKGPDFIVTISSYDGQGKCFYKDLMGDEIINQEKIERIERISKAIIIDQTFRALRGVEECLYQKEQKETLEEARRLLGSSPSPR